MRSTLVARSLRPLLALTLLGALSLPAYAWIYPEHRDLNILAVQRLDPERRAVFDRLWSEARAGDEQRLCAAGADTEQSTTPSCIDWAALSAIAGDHSCSSREMFETARSAPWILQVADVAAQLKLDLARIPLTATPEQPEASKDMMARPQRRIASEAARAQRINALRTSDIRLQRADPEYATRAGSNDAHFLLARPDTNIEAADYAALTVRRGPDQRHRCLQLLPPERTAEGLAPGRGAAACACRAGRARPRRAGGRGVRAALPGGRVRRRPHRRNLGRCLAARRARTTSTTRTGSRSSPGPAAAAPSC